MLFLERVKSTLRNEWSLIVLFVLSVVIRLYAAWQPSRVLVQWFLPDDAYYYFQVAKNIATGFGSTFDTIHLTNGYHPLWMVIATGVYKIFDSMGDIDLPIHVLLSIGGLFWAGVGAITYHWLLQQTSSKKIAWCATAVVLFIPTALFHSLDGLETSLANFCLISFAYLINRTIARPRTPFQLILLSVASAGTILARLDLGLFVLIGWGYWLWKNRRAVTFRELGYVFMPAMVLLGSMVIAWIHWFGTPIPQSGNAFTLVQHTLFFYKPRSFIMVILWSVYQTWGTAMMAIRVGGLGPVAGLLLFAPFLRWMPFVRKHSEKVNELKRYFPWVIGMGLFIFFQGGIRWSGREWYFSSVLWLSVLIAAIIFSLLSTRRSRIFFGIVSICSLIYASRLSFQPHFKNQDQMFDAAHSVASLVPTSSRIGAWNAGIMGYYSQRTVVNLDGLINNSAYEAMKAGRMASYIQTEGIEYVLDYPIAYTYRHRPFFERDPISLLESEPIQSFDGGGYHGNQLELKKVIR